MPKSKKQPIVKSRKGWDKAFRLMHQHGDDVLLDRESLPANKWDRTEWRW